MDQKKEKRIAYAELLNRCWEDAEYLERFRNDPATVLAEAGIETVTGAVYHVVEQSDVCRYLVVPEETPEEQINVISEQLKEKIKAQTGEPFAGELKVLKNTPKDIYLIYQPKPENFELTDEMLADVSGGGFLQVYQNAVILTDMNVIAQLNATVEANLILYVI